MEDIIYPKTKVYIKVDNNNNVVDINSSIFVKDTDGWIYIDEGYGDKYDHAQSLYLNKPLINEKGQYNYKIYRPVNRVGLHSIKELEDFKGDVIASVISTEE